MTGTGKSSPQHIKDGNFRLRPHAAANKSPATSSRRKTSPNKANVVVSSTSPKPRKQMNEHPSFKPYRESSTASNPFDEDNILHRSSH